MSKKDPDSNVIEVAFVRQSPDGQTRPLSAKPIRPSIELHGAKRAQFDMYVLGGVHKPVELHVIFKDVAAKKSTLGALSITPQQWEQLKREGDRLIAAHQKLLKK